jgi:HEAT repeat protein
LAQRRALYERLLSDVVSGLPDAALKVPTLDPLDRQILEALLKRRLALLVGADRMRFVGLIDTGGFVDPYVSQLRHTDHHVRAKACEVLGNLELERCATAVKDLLQDPEPEVRMVAARALVKIIRAHEFLGGDAEERDQGGLDSQQVIKALSAQLKRANRWLRLSVVESLEMIGGEAVSVLIGELNTPDDMVRATITDTLGRLHDVKANAALTERLKDESVEVRTRACEALGLIGAPGSVDPLTEMLKDPVWQTRAQAAKALGLIGSRDAIPALRHGLRDSNWWVRSNSANSLSQIGGEGLGVLLELLHSDDQFARERAAEELQRRSLVGAIIGHWRERHTPEDHKILVNLCRAGSPSPILALLGEVNGSEQAALLSVLEEALQSIEDDLLSGVPQRQTISARAYRKIQGANLSAALRRIEPGSPEAATGRSRVAELTGRIEDRLRTLEPADTSPSPTPRKRRRFASLFSRQQLGG